MGQSHEDELDAQFREVPMPAGTPGSASSVQTGRLFLPQQQLLLYSPDEWEEFIHEWVDSKRARYAQVLRFGGSGDMGIDVAAFTDDRRLLGTWDNYQCKHYKGALTPRDAVPEIAKILWHSFQERYSRPRCYYFVAPQGCGMSLRKLLTNARALKQHVIDRWDDQCGTAVTKQETILLNGAFKSYVDGFDFSIFKERTALEIIAEHRLTPYFAVRFGGGLPRPRPAVQVSPYQPEESASRYVQQLFEAYSEHTNTTVRDLACFAARSELTEHFHRQREFFYHAEALRNFARDTVPEGTFEDLQTEVHAGVIEVEAAQHADGYARVQAVTQAAVTLELTSNALMSVVRVQDRRGMCHQLANDNRLRWRKP
jgi:hypothetical protein